MSTTVVRGSPNEAQLYLDRVIDDLLKSGITRSNRNREQVNLADILFYCLRSNPNGINMINGATDKTCTNQQILKRAVAFARAMRTMCARETTVIIMLRNHEHMSALYYAVLLAGIVPFMMEPSSTEYEIEHFLTLVSPCLIFCEPERRDEVVNVVRQTSISPDVISADGPALDRFSEKQSDDIGSFELPEVGPDEAAILMPTSGSTGQPKAAILTHRGLIMQLPSPWLHHNQFPQPSRLVLLLSTGQWMTHTMTMTSCCVYGIPVLLSSKRITAEHVVDLLDKYLPSWSIISPALAASMGNMVTTKQLSCFETLCLSGSPFALETVSQLKSKMSQSACLSNVYGLTETQGIVAMGVHTTPLTSVGKVANFIEYKLVTDDGKEVIGSKQKGELYLRSKSILKGYLKNEAAYKNSVTPDGWLKTGDIFYKDEHDQLFFLNRNKLGFKYLNHHVYPEELESVIGSVPGVQQCVVCGVDAGPAAAVVLQPGCDVTREMIHQAVSSKLSDYKHLRGGIAFVQELPRTHNGKLSRAHCHELVKDLVSKGECF